MQRLLERHLACRRFEECRAPLAVNAFDIGARRPVFLDRGELAPAVRASASLPGLFQPIRVGEAWYVDAGFVEKTPVGALLDREDLDLVLVHHLPSAASPPRPGRPGPVDLARAALEALRRRLDEALLEAAHRRGRRLRVIRPTRVPRVDPFHLDRGASALAAARSQAREALGRLAAEGAG
jgi:NTE family protein